MDISLIQEWTNKLSEWTEAAITQSPRFIAGFVIFILFIFLSKKIYTNLRKFLKHRKSLNHNPIINFLSRLVQILIIVGGAIVALGIMDLDKTVTSLLAGAGIVAFALGFAFQDLAENFIAGILLAVKQPCTVGDIVRIKGIEGIVQRIDIRETTLHSFDGAIVIIPNKEMIDSVFENISGTGKRRIEIECGVAYDTDLEKARKIAIAAVEQIKERDSQEEVTCFYSEFGDSSIQFSLYFWINNQSLFLHARNAAIVSVHQAFQKEKIDIPFPIRTIISK